MLCFYNKETEYNDRIVIDKKPYSEKPNKHILPIKINHNIRFIEIEVPKECKNTVIEDNKYFKEKI